MRLNLISSLVSGFTLTVLAFVTVSKLLAVLLLVRAMTDILGLLGYLF